MGGHKIAVKKQKQNKKDRKRLNAEHCDINNIYYRRLKRAMIACGHTRKYKRRRMIETYINLNSARCWIKMNNCHTFAEYRDKFKDNIRHRYWFALDNPKKRSEYRELVYREIIKGVRYPKPKPVNGEYKFHGEKSFEITTF